MLEVQGEVRAEVQSPERLERHQRMVRRLGLLYGAQSAQALLAQLQALAAHWSSRLPPSTPPLDERDVVVIAYPDHLQRPGEAPLATLADFCVRRLEGLVSTVHVLPFHPSTSYEGYAITDYRAVDPTLGGDEHLQSLVTRFRCMTDLVLNHCSSSHPWFQQFLRDEEPGRRYFIVVEDPQEPWLRQVARARDLPLLHRAQTPAGERHVWTTYSPDLVDLNWSEPDVLLEMVDVLFDALARGASIMRLDAFVYVWKEAHTNCVNRPLGHELLRLLQEVLAEAGAASALLLPSITNVTQEQNYRYFGEGEGASPEPSRGEREADLIYHLPLSSLVLHALVRGHASWLRDWLRSLPEAPPGRAYYHVTATHDGIGLSWLADVLPHSEIEALVQAMRENGSLLSSRRPNADGQQQPWELNATWWSACRPLEGYDEGQHLRRVALTQAVSLSVRGVPALYLTTLLGGENDYARAEAWADPRAINRARFQVDEWERAFANVEGRHHRLFELLSALLRARRGQRAFHPQGGQVVLEPASPGLLLLLRIPPGSTAGAVDNVLCVANFGAEAQPLLRSDLGAWASSPLADGRLREIIEGRLLRFDGRAPLWVAPYEVLWLTGGGGYGAPALTSD